MVQNPNTVAIIGCDGMVGHHLENIFLNNKVKVFSYSHKDIDVTDRDSVLSLIDNKDLCGSTIFNCTMVNNALSPDYMYKVNVDGVQNIIELCSILSAELFHFSSDYVFSDMEIKGNLPLYCSSPKKYVYQQTYAQTKKLAEIKIKEAQIFSNIIRTSWVFGTGKYKPQRNFTSFVIRRLLENKQIIINTNDTSRPTPVKGLCADVFKIWNENKYYYNRIQLFDVKHCVGQEIHTRYSWAVYIAKIIEEMYNIDCSNLITYDINNKSIPTFTPLGTIGVGVICQHYNRSIHNARIKMELSELIFQIERDLDDN